MPTLQANGITLAYEIVGSGPPLLLISGLGYGGWIWGKVAPLLSDENTIITFDNRGAGGSDKPDGPYSTALMAMDAIGLLDGLGIPKTHVLGHSLGGYIAQEIALARPDLVDKLILASTTHGGRDVIPIPPEALSVMMDRSGDPLDVLKRGITVATAPGWPEEHPESVEELIRYRLTGPVPPAAYASQVAAGAAHDAAARLNQITKSPVLILAGDADNVVPPGNAELIATKIPAAQTQIFRNAGHMLPIEAPRELAAAVRAFLRDPT